MKRTAFHIQSAGDAAYRLLNDTGFPAGLKVEPNERNNQSV